MSDFYYEDNGSQRGPVSEEDLRTLLSQGFLLPNTRVWTSAFGGQWLPASQTKLADSILRAGPPPLPPAQDKLHSLQDHGSKPTSRLTNLRPPDLQVSPVELTRNVVTTGRQTPSLIYVRLIAFFPLFLLAVELALRLANIDPDVFPVSSGLAFWSFIINLGLARGDARALTRAGLNSDKKQMVAFMILTPVGYLIRRKVVAGASLVPLWVWLGCAGAYLLVTTAVSSP